MDRTTLGHGERLEEEERNAGKPTEAGVKGQKYQNSQMNLSRITRLTGVAALMCVGQSRRP